MRTSFAKLMPIAALVLAGCGDGGGGIGPGEGAPLRIVAGSGATDTIGTKLAQALVAEVRGPDGSPRPDVVVRFTPLAMPGVFNFSAFVAPLTSSFYTSFATATTNSRGQASVLVQLGQRSGAAKIVIDVPELGLQDTARYTVLPGAAASLTIGVRDTSLWLGQDYTINAAAADRFGNARPSDPITYVSRSGVVTVNAAGKVTAAQEGRGTIVIETANAKDSAQVSIVPQGMLVVWGNNKVATVNTNGTQYKVLTTGTDLSLYPQWSPDGTKVIFYEADPGSNSRISFVDMNGVRTPFLGPSSSLRAASYGRFSPDGNWVYFTGISSTPGEFSFVTWRVRLDGSQLEQVGPSSSEGGSLRPDISPDGKTEVFQANTGMLGSMDLATHTIHSFGIAGAFPRYSPDGTQIAYTVGGFNTTQLYIMKADGTGARSVTSNATYHDLSGVDWSPDGKWLLASKYNSSFEIVRVADGLRLPLGVTGLQAAWKR